MCKSWAQSRVWHLGEPYFCMTFFEEEQGRERDRGERKRERELEEKERRRRRDRIGKDRKGKERN